MANKFWVGGAGSWSDTAHWATSSNGAGSTGIPATGDNVTFDALSGGGNVVCDIVSGLSLNSLTAHAFTGTLDFTTAGGGTDPNITFTRSDGSAAVNLSGTGARKYLLGSGTFTFTGTSAATYFDIGTTTNLDPTSVTTCPIVFSANTSSERQFNGGGRTFGTLTIAANTGRGGVRIFSANTFSSITVAAGTSYLMLPASTTTTISGSAGLVLTGSSTNPMVVLSSTVNSGTTTLSLSSGTSTPTWTAFMGVTTTGSGTLTATNSFDLGRNTLDTGDTITAPSGGGGTTVGVIG
jgi:hypothetical protein